MLARKGLSVEREMDGGHIWRSYSESGGVETVNSKPIAPMYYICRNPKFHTTLLNLPPNKIRLLIIVVNENKLLQRGGLEFVPEQAIIGWM